jgi:hypothetical protein
MTKVVSVLCIFVHHFNGKQYYPVASAINTCMGFTDVYLPTVRVRVRVRVRVVKLEVRVRG